MLPGRIGYFCGMAQTDLALFGSGGRLTIDPEAWAPAGVRGADKVAQRFVYGLLSPRGSVPGRPADGSDFLGLAAAFRSEFDVFAAFATAYPQAEATARAAEAPDDPAAERFGAARLAAVVVEAGAVTLSLEVAAADGSAPATPVDFTLPT